MDSIISIDKNTNKKWKIKDARKMTVKRKKSYTISKRIPVKIIGSDK